MEVERKISKNPHVYEIYDTTGDWDSIRFMPNADNGSSIKYCKIEYAREAIRYSGSNPLIIQNITHNQLYNNSVCIYYYISSL